MARNRSSKSKTLTPCAADTERQTQIVNLNICKKFHTTNYLLRTCIALWLLSLFIHSCNPKWEEGFTFGAPYKWAQSVHIFLAIEADPFHAIIPTSDMAKKGGGNEDRKVAPRGHFVVYVGSEMKRYIVPTYFLKNPLFQQLLDRAAEEYGFDSTSRITLPCDESTFQSIISLLSK